jgi:hypothetical protein
VWVGCTVLIPEPDAAYRNRENCNVGRKRCGEREILLTSQFILALRTRLQGRKVGASIKIKNKIACTIFMCVMYIAYFYIKVLIKTLKHHMF